MSDKLVGDVVIFGLPIIMAALLWKFGPENLRKPPMIYLLLLFVATPIIVTLMPMSVIQSITYQRPIAVPQTARLVLSAAVLVYALVMLATVMYYGLRKLPFPKIVRTGRWVLTVALFVVIFLVR
jgi:hypothetical protein